MCQVSDFSHWDLESTNCKLHQRISPEPSIRLIWNFHISSLLIKRFKNNLKPNFQISGVDLRSLPELRVAIISRTVNLFIFLVHSWRGSIIIWSPRFTVLEIIYYKHMWFFNLFEMIKIVSEAMHWKWKLKINKM